MAAGGVLGFRVGVAGRLRVGVGFVDRVGVGVSVVGCGGVARSLDVAVRIFAVDEILGRIDSEVELVVVLEEFDDEERQGAQPGDGQQDHESLFLPELSASHGPGHREAAEEQDDGVDGSEGRVQEHVPVREDLRVIGPVNHVCGKQSAEKQNLGDQEQPHSQLAAVELLFVILEVVRQEWRMPVAVIVVVAVSRDCGGGESAHAEKPCRTLFATPGKPVGAETLYSMPP